jgi:hypothetical protein
MRQLFSQSQTKPQRKLRLPQNARFLPDALLRQRQQSTETRMPHPGAERREAEGWVTTKP